jgi:hypothetical protein
MPGFAAALSGGERRLDRRLGVDAEIPNFRRCGVEPSDVAAGGGLDLDARPGPVGARETSSALQSPIIEIVLAAFGLDDGG